MDLESAYRQKYNPWPVLERLNTDRSKAIQELWENLYHQGDVGTASYASVARLVEAGELDLVASIEVARHDRKNPSVPAELEGSYLEALSRALERVPEDAVQLQGYYSIHASLQGKYDLAKAINIFDVNEILSQFG